MPRTLLGEKYKREQPPVDNGWGAILVRKEQMGLSLKDIADQTGLNYGRLRRFWGLPPIEWNYDDLVRILDLMGLEAKLEITENGRA